MGSDTTPRHRAEMPRTAAWSDLRRSVAHLLAGRDLYADDLLLRPVTADDEEIWAAAITPAARPGRRTANA